MGEPQPLRSSLVAFLTLRLPWLEHLGFLAVNVRH